MILDTEVKVTRKHTIFYLAILHLSNRLIHYQYFTKEDGYFINCYFMCKISLHIPLVAVFNEDGKLTSEASTCMDHDQS